MYRLIYNSQTKEIIDIVDAIGTTTFTVHSIYEGSREELENYINENSLIHENVEVFWNVVN